MAYERTIGPTEAARLLGKDRKQLQRWRDAGGPFSDDGKCHPDELREWAIATGRLDRGAHRPPEVERLTAEVVAAPTPRPAPESAARSSLEGLTDDERAAVEAILGGDPRKLAELAATIDANLLKRLAAMGRTRRELAEAERRELDNAARRAELHEVEACRARDVRQIQAVKDRFAAIPGKLAQRLEGMNYEQRYQALRDELDSVLEGFAGGQA